MTSLVFLFLLQCTMADLYLHMPRGSNNRLDEANRDRANGNRLFDSQNNNRGGYNVGSVYYTQGSTLYSQWTNQHTCGAANNDCEFVIQYMCDDWLRDGTTTKRIPEDDWDCYEEECDTDTEYGRHETQGWYEQCQARSRNHGLFTANQKLNGNDATKTRQNPNGNRNGYECPEERDYYPYWYPTPWVDIAILTNAPTRCAEYQAKSENVLGRWYCEPPASMYEAYTEDNQKGWIPITEAECIAMYYIPEVDDDTTVNVGTDAVPTTIEWAVWKQSEPHNVAAPACKQNWWSRDNHLGNVDGGYMSMYNWTMPTDWTNEQCAFRMRYNITTSEYPAFESSTSVEAGLDYRNNSQASNINADDDPAWVKIWEDYYMTEEEVAPSFDENNNNNEAGLTESREYVLKNNPAVDIFGAILTTTPGEAKLQLNINTNQFGRTFQDRSHRFALRANSEECSSTVTHNLQVRGKRGNVVQTYPGMEYDFVPEHLKVAVNECVHIQWTGSNTNPNNNAGQGRQGTDRHNIVELRAPNYNENQPVTIPETYGQFGNSFPNKITDTEFLGFSDADETNLALNTPYAFGGELSELDDAGVYFDLAPKKVTREGIYHYLCTRNNNFSNRSQKGKIDVTATSTAFASIGWEGGEIEANNGAVVTIEAASFTSAVTVTLSTEPNTVSEYGSGAKSDYIMVSMSESTTFTMDIPYDRLSLYSSKVVWHTDQATRDFDADGWEKIVDTEHEAGVVSFQANAEGVYAVQKAGLAAGWLVGIIFGSLFGVVGMMYLVNHFTGLCGFLPFSGGGSPISRSAN